MLQIQKICKERSDKKNPKKTKTGVGSIIIEGEEMRKSP
jgi:hypothetical protein